MFYVGMSPSLVTNSKPFSRLVKSLVIFPSISKVVIKHNERRDKNTIDITISPPSLLLLSIFRHVIPLIIFMWNRIVNQQTLTCVFFFLPWKRSREQHLYYYIVFAFRAIACHFSALIPRNIVMSTVQKKKKFQIVFTRICTARYYKHGLMRVELTMNVFW